VSEPEPLPIIGCESTTFYRNKLDFSFAPKRWITRAEVDEGLPVEDRRALGFHVKGRFDRVLDVERCYLQPDPSNDIRTAAREIATARNLSFHDPAEHTGLLRSLVVRTTRDGEVMVILVIAEDRPDVAASMLDELRNRVPGLSSGHYVVNPTLNDDISPHPAIHVFGEPTLTERCGHLRFLIHPKSFYQTNSEQAEKLYGIVRSWLQADGSETLLDLYCGIGSIGLFVADLVRSVVGVESVPEAVERARQNAVLNAIGNTRFLSGDVRNVLESAQVPKPDIVVLDPPRAGLHPDVLGAVTRLLPRQIIYVSCKPSTQARDLITLNERYRIERIQPVDMFPQTFHIENVVDLRLR
jgi:23S rRNA (uracil1939-C5)-methyltransferase